MTHVRTRKIVEDSRLAGPGRGLNAHRMIGETAVKLAQEDFDWFMSADNYWWSIFKGAPKKKGMVLYLAAVAPLYLEPARKVLTDALSLSEDQCSQHMKDAIVAALVQDTDLRANRLDLPMDDYEAWRGALRLAIRDVLYRAYYQRFHQPRATVH